MLRSEATKDLRLLSSTPDHPARYRRMADDPFDTTCFEWAQLQSLRKNPMF